MSIECVSLCASSPLNFKNDELKEIQCQFLEQGRGQTDNKKQKSSTKLVVDFSGDEMNKLIVIHRRQEELNTLKESVEKKIEQIEDEIYEMQRQISDEILETIRTTNSASEKKQEAIKKAIKKVMTLYADSKGQMSKQQAQALLSNEIGSINTFLPSVISNALYSSYSKMSDLRLKINMMSYLSNYDDRISTELCENNEILNKYYNPYDNCDTNFHSSNTTNPISLNQMKVIGNNICLGALSSMQNTAQRVKNGEDSRLNVLTNNGVFEIKQAKEYKQEPC